jgi:hypothetical protein
MKGFERRLERMVEGTFARVFRSGLRPVELGRRLVREMEDGRSVGVGGRMIVPNDFSVYLSEADFERFGEVHDSLRRELADAARDQAREENYDFMGPVQVNLVTDSTIRTGSFQIEARLKEGLGGSGAGSVLLPDATRLLLTSQPLLVGRTSECDITINDRNVSRNHAEIRPQGHQYVLVDLGSTNGSRVNGVRVTEQVLVDGDQLGFGNTTVVFEES